MRMQQSKEIIVTLTEKAAEKAKKLLEKDGKQGYGLRVGVVAGGCSSYMYDIGFEKTPKGNDTVIEEKGVKVFINPESLAFMKGATVDYNDTLTNAGFKIKNPNVKTSCACGHSVG
ncbi:iron-sulfur cluster assembly accessory protein [Candidatus Woesearchaeota archaeon]|nr:iron-sulfur cluster assembly accessory protein [Candidatus Woesearchaeota archaeon]